MAKRPEMPKSPPRWKCPSCRKWRTEPIGMRCAECEAMLRICDEVGRNPRKTDFEEQ